MMWDVVCDLLHASRQNRVGFAWRNGLAAEELQGVHHLLPAILAEWGRSEGPGDRSRDQRRSGKTEDNGIAGKSTKQVSLKKRLTQSLDPVQLDSSWKVLLDPVVFISIVQFLSSSPSTKGTPDPPRSHGSVRSREPGAGSRSRGPFGRRLMGGTSEAARMEEA